MRPLDRRSLNVELLVTGITIRESNPPGCALAEAWRVLFRGRIPRHLNFRCGSGGRGIFAGFAGGSLAHAAGSSDQIRKASPHSRVVYLARSGVTCQETECLRHRTKLALWNTSQAVSTLCSPQKSTDAHSFFLCPPCGKLRQRPLRYVFFLGRYIIT